MVEKFYLKRRHCAKADQNQIFLIPHNVDSCGINIHILDKIVQFTQRAAN